MVKFLDTYKFEKLIVRKTPYIIFFYKEDNDYSKDVINSLVKLNNSFPPVLCYIRKCKQNPRIRGQNINSLENVYYICNQKIKKMVSGTSYSELFEIFRSALYSAFRNYSSHYMKVMKTEFGVENYRFMYPEAYEPDFQKIQKFHRIWVNPIAHHKYTYPERLFLSSLSDCRTPNEDSSKFGEVKQNGTIQKDEIISQEKLLARSLSLNPNFPGQELEFRPPTPYGNDIKEKLKFKRKKIRLGKKASNHQNNEKLT